MNFSGNLTKFLIQDVWKNVDKFNQSERNFPLFVDFCISFECPLHSDFVNFVILGNPDIHHQMHCYRGWVVFHRIRKFSYRKTPIRLLLNQLWPCTELKNQIMHSENDLRCFFFLIGNEVSDFKMNWSNSNWLFSAHQNVKVLFLLSVNLSVFFFPNFSEYILLVMQIFLKYFDKFTNNSLLLYMISWKKDKLKTKNLSSPDKEV